jgi:hypothetical protein
MGNLEMRRRAAIRTIAVQAAMPGELGATLAASWRRWDGDGTVDSDNPGRNGKAPRPDCELSLGIRGLEGASWDVHRTQHEEAGQLSATELDVSVIRAYAELLLELADKVEMEHSAAAAYEREHERTMRRRTRHARH